MTPVAAPEAEGIVVIDVDLQKVPECDACHHAAEFKLRCRACPGSFLACAGCLRMLHEQVEGPIGMLLAITGNIFVTPCCEAPVFNVDAAYEVSPL